MTLQFNSSFKIQLFQYAKRILPHVGLVILLFFYLIAGAFLFRYLEAPKELEVRFINSQKSISDLDSESWNNHNSGASWRVSRPHLEHHTSDQTNQSILYSLFFLRMLTIGYPVKLSMPSIKSTSSNLSKTCSLLTAINSLLPNTFSTRQEKMKCFGPSQIQCFLLPPSSQLSVKEGNKKD